MHCMTHLVVLVALVLLSACDPPTAPTRRLVQCCQSIHKCYVPEANERVCRAGYEAVWGER